VTGGGRSLILLTVIPSRGLTSILRRWMHLRSVVCSMWCGKSKFRQRFQCLLGDYFAIDFQLRTNLFVGKSFITTTCPMLEVAVPPRWRFIFFLIVTSLAACDIFYIGGSTSLSYHHIRFVITFISLVIWRGYCDLHILS
jgi:hypothetical protein